MKIMQTTETTERIISIHSSRVSSGSTTKPTRALATAPQPYQPSQPHVLTEDVKAQLAEANQRRRENLYPRLAQALATVEQSSITRSYSEERAMSLQELAAANKARRSRLREAGYSLPMVSMA
ncbi:hypothetical protein E4P32_05110 [Herbaspirillum sp. 3R11]|nr:hypothetical protein DZB54_03060 [Herbaspirillum sp. 3R-3a1]TFI11508.1 hypothetical protein E4P32_05110 [Herbaspirillum sp. 3R11]TFI17413.1 hypothetical protein E4P31_05115 [Herbaspirillum sp. 3R-11]TFI26099.1 hypothetical protein E4P30_12235 [Herbaspirillum sp. 3C11]